MDKKYDSFKDLPKKVTDNNHILYLDTYVEGDVKDILYKVTVYCRLTDTSKVLIKTCRANLAHGFMRKRAGELGCIWRDNTKAGYGG